MHLSKDFPLSDEVTVDEDIDWKVLFEGPQTSLPSPGAIHDGW